MFEQAWRKVAIYGRVVAAAVALVATTAHSMSVTPVVVDLAMSGQRMSEIVTIENTYARPIILEMQVQKAEYTDQGVSGTGKETDDLLVFPPQVQIAPGASQAVRVQYVGDPDFSQSKHYFVTVAQLPVKLPEGESAVQLLYNFQIVVGVGKPDTKPSLAVKNAEVEVSDDGKALLVLVMENTSSTYGYLSGGSLQIVQKNEAGEEIFKKTMTAEQVSQEIGYGLVGAGQIRRILTPVVLPQTGGSVEASFTASKR